MMLIGEYIQKIGDKHRVAIPLNLRNILGDNLIITKGYENCLIIISKDKWETLISENISGPFTSGLIRETSRFLLGSATEINLDFQGRFVIPKQLRTYASIEEYGAFIGLGKWVELWDEKRWESKKSEIEKNSSIVGDKLASFKFND